MLDELPADRGELLPEKRLASREIQVFDRPELLGEFHELIERQNRLAG